MDIFSKLSSFFLREFDRNQFIRYVLIGCTAAAIEYAFFSLCVLSAGPFAANFFARILAMSVHFFMLKLAVFHGRLRCLEIFNYVVVSLTGGILVGLGLEVTRYFGVEGVAIIVWKLFFDLTLCYLSYLTSKTYIFRTRV